MDIELLSPEPLLVSTHSEESKPEATKPYDVSESTRKGVNFGIVFSSFIALGSFAVGIAILAGLQTFFTSSSVVAQILSLGFNFIVSVCTEILSYAHSVSLRWALYQERRLEYNSNLRLFTSTKKSRINRWPVNLLSAVCLVMSYTAANQAVLISDPGQQHMISMNGIALLMLGAALIGQIAIAILCMRQSGQSVWTWNPNAPNAALALLTEGTFQRKPGRGLMSVHQKDLPALPQFPLKRQQPMSTGYRNSTYIVYFVIFIVALNFSFAAAVYKLTIGQFSPDLSFFVETDSSTSTADLRGTFGFEILAATPVLIELLMYLCGMAFQSIITLTLHSVELVINVSRDEAQWRDASKSQGAVVSSHAVGSAVSSWPWWVLFVTKPVAQWLLGSVGMSLGQRARGDPVVWFNCVPLFVLAGVMTILGMMLGFLVYYKPKGPQPAAFGHFQTLVDLVDDWGQGKDDRLFWGVTGDCHAGTARQQFDVGEVDWNTCYE